MKAEKCRSCGAPIVWAVSARGKRMPFNAEPTAAGTWHLEETAPGEVRAAHGPGPDGHVSHFATCPNARQHRKGKS